MLKIATVCTGIGSPEMALANLEITHEIVFGCEIDKYARNSFLANFQPKLMLEDMTKQTWEGEEFYADLFIGGIPCQAFSLAGKRLGELDPRGLLFYDFYRYVKVQQPKYFIIENVKGLLSMNKGEVFQNWKMLLGKSENGNMFLHNHEDSLLYNLHWQVQNTKKFGLPQNRERVFLVGIRNDLPNDFVFPKGFPLTKRLKDVLETNVDEKYYLSEKLLNHFKNKKGSYAGLFKVSNGNDIANCIPATYYKMPITNTYIQEPQIGAMRGRNPDNPKSRQAGLPTEQMLEINKEGISNTLTSVQKDNLVIEPKVIQLNPSKESGGNQPYQQNRFYDINGLMTTLDTDFRKNILVPELKQVAQLEGFESEGRMYDANGISRTIKDGGGGGAKTGWYLVDEKINYRIRRLTPKECFRLQGYSDEFFEKCQAVNSDTQLYKQAGNTISVPVIQSILERLIK